MPVETVRQEPIPAQHGGSAGQRTPPRPTAAAVAVAAPALPAELLLSEAVVPEKPLVAAAGCSSPVRWGGAAAASVSSPRGRPASPGREGTRLLVPSTASDGAQLSLQKPVAACAHTALPIPLWDVSDLLALGEVSPRTPRRSLVYSPTPSSGMVTMTSVATPLRSPTSNCTPSRQLTSPVTPRTPWGGGLLSPTALGQSAQAAAVSRLTNMAAGLSATQARVAEWHKLYMDEVGRQPADANQFRAFVLNRGGNLPYCVARRVVPSC